MRILYSFLILVFFTSQCFSQSLSISKFEVTNIGASSLTFSWENSVEAESTIKYGFTKDLELGQESVASTTSPSISIGGLAPARMVYVQATADSGSETDETEIMLYMTRSLSSGDKKVYFNQPVSYEYAHEGNEAIYVDRAIDDTLIEYIKRATMSIDIAIYNTTSSTTVSDYISALNDAHDAGIDVRVIYNGNTGNTGIDNLHPDIPRLESPEADFNAGIGIMHNKFIVFDAEATDADLPLVWTGSTNLTPNQINRDPNNVIIIQDQSLARTYTVEFNEMWGSETMTPDENNAKWGQEKEDNTPHFFNIGGDHVECYFSPSDGTQSRLIKAIYDAEDELMINTMLITREQIASAITNQHDAGVNVAMHINSEGESSQVIDQLKSSLNGRLAEYSSVTGQLHHKLMFANAISNNGPYVLTGSHNWSFSADNRNDENTLIIYNEDIVNQYFQEFMARHEPIVSSITAVDDFADINSTGIETIPVSDNDDYYYMISPKISVATPPKHGTASGSTNGVLNYIAEDGYKGKDSVEYRTCNETIFNYCDSAWVYLEINTVSLQEHQKSNRIKIYPVPSSSEINIIAEDFQFDQLKIVDLSGRVVYTEKLSYPVEEKQVEVSTFSSGIYWVEVQGGGERVHHKIVIQ